MYVYRSEGMRNKRGETTEETRTRETMKDIRNKISEINLFDRISEIEYFYRRWILNILGLLKPGMLFSGCNFRYTLV